MTGNRERRHDRENEDQADQQVERAAEADGDLGGVGLPQVGQPRAQAHADPGEPHAEDGHHPDMERDHHGAHPQHEVAQKDEPLGGDQGDPHREGKLTPEDLRPAPRAAGRAPRSCALPARAAGR